jgi:parvulin-like peptidyl-prolyl isomerase
MSTILPAVAIAGFLCASPGVAPAAEGRARPDDDATIVARVNGEPVTRAELQRMRDHPLTRRQLLDVGGEAPSPEELDRVSLRRLIHRRLMLEEARRRRIAVSDDELDAAIASLRGRFDDLAGFGSWMKEQGLADRSLFDTVRADMLTDRVWASLVAGVRISDDEAQRYYDANARELVIGEEVRLSLIVVKDEAAAEEVLAALRKGESFRALARQRSLGIRAAQGGDTGWVDTRTLPEPLRKPVQLLKPGDVGGPLQKGPGEVLVVGLEARRPIRARSLAEARHEIERRLLPSAQQEVVRAWLTEQEAKSNIEVFTAVELSHAAKGQRGR